MKTLADVILNRASVSELDEAFILGTSGDRRLLREANAHLVAVRAVYGLAATPQPLLTAPEGNAKLAKGGVPTYGLTLQHYVQKLSTGLTVNACPWAGDCTKMCVLDGGRAMMDKRIIPARRAKTEFFALHPHEAFYLLGRELRRAVKRHGYILFRPNVNSDLPWHVLLPALTSGSTFGARVSSCGCAKDPSILSTDGWLADRYRVAYSLNESSDRDAVRGFLDRGGSVAMVTDRKKGQRVPRRASLPGGRKTWRALDADLTDEWIFQPSVIGDLSAKGAARKYIGKTDFIVRSKP